MREGLKRILVASALFGAVAAGGCNSDEHPPIETDSSKLTPGMENMKNEMMKQYKAKNFNPKPATSK